MQERHRSLTEITENLIGLSLESLTEVVRLRLQKQPTSVYLPSLGRDEDPTDILIECFRKSPDRLEKVRVASVHLADEWLDQPDHDIQQDREPIAELLYLCASIGAYEAIPAIAKVADRETLSSVVLLNGEDLQNFALRSLAGLLVQQPREVQDNYRHLFETALKTPRHAAIGLTTLATLWSEEKQRYIEQALSYNDPQLRRVVSNLDIISTTFSRA